MFVFLNYTQITFEKVSRQVTETQLRLKRFLKLVSTNLLAIIKQKKALSNIKLITGPSIEP